MTKNTAYLAFAPMQGYTDAVYRHAVDTLCGDSRILARLHAFWEYPDIDHKARKAIMKATSWRRYDEAVVAVWSSFQIIK